jgi:CHAT domain-containing protein
MDNKGKNEIREYLLGRIADANILEGIEGRLFSDDEYCSQVEVVEEELVHDFVFGKLSPRDREAFEEKIADNSEIRFKTEMAQALKEKARETRKAPEANAVEAVPGFLASLKAFFRQPAYAGAFAALLLGILILSFFMPGRGNSDLAELRNIYKQERAVESRISGFDYAPLEVTRGQVKDEAKETRLLSIRANLLRARVTSPTAENYYALGVFYLTQQDFPGAIKELGKAVELDDKNTRAHNDLGSAYFEAALKDGPGKNIENLARANEEFTRATELDPQFLEALFNRSLTLQKMTLPQQAKESWNLYLQKDPSSKWAEEARRHLSELENQQSAVKKKADMLPDLIAAYRKPDEPDEQTLWNMHAETKNTFNSLSAAEQLTRGYLKAKREHDEVQAKELLDILNRIGELEKEKNADFFFAELAAFYAKVDETNIDKLQEAKETSDKGRDLLYHQAASSIEQFEKSRELFQQLGDSPEKYVAELWAAQALPDVGKISESRVRLTSLIESSEERNYKVLLPTAYYWIATGEGKQQKSSLSIKSFQKALQKADEVSAFYEIRHSSQELADAYIDLGEPEKALDYYDKVIDKVGTYRDAAQTRRNLVTFARVFGKLGLNSTAVDFALENIFLNKPNKSLSKTDLVNGSLEELTAALARKKQFDKALKFADESNEIALSGEQSNEKDLTIAGTYLSRADLKYQLENYNGALADYDKSLEFYGKFPEITYNIYKVHKGKLLCFQLLGKQGEFESELEKVLRLSEEYRRNIREDDSRQAFFDNEQMVFDAAAANALQQNDNREAFKLVENSKARSLLDFVKSERSIAEVDKEFASVAKSLTLQEIQARMPENVQVIQYAVLREKLAIWMLTKDRFEFSEQQISDVELEKKVSAYRTAVLEKDSSASLRPKAKELYDILLPKNYDRTKTICLVPDKFLYKISFVSLVSAADKFLIEDSPVLYSPSASIFVLASENAGQKGQAAAEHLLSVGNPAFDREENPKLAALPQAETEVEMIAREYPGAQKFIGDKATRENFLNNIGNAEVIHFAGHFVANDDLPGYSKLLFAGGDLRSFELAEKRLPKAKLVVLSACGTGYEHYNQSEGAIGIARTFLATGAPLVLASNWQVDSEATKDLMIAFHLNRKEKGLSSSESLRQAQLELLKKEATGAPYYWSAFNLVGGFAAY